MTFNPDNPNEHEEWKESQDTKRYYKIVISGTPDEVNMLCRYWVNAFKGKDVQQVMVEMWGELWAK